MLNVEFTLTYYALDVDFTTCVAHRVGGITSPLYLMHVQHYVLHGSTSRCL